MSISVAGGPVVKSLDGPPEEEPDDFGDPSAKPEPVSGIKAQKMMPWLKLRHLLGQSRDRARWLQFHCAVTDYSPFRWQIRAHLHHSGAEPDVRTNKLVVSGIRAGKSEWARHEHEMLHTFLPGANHLMVAPTYDQCREVLLRPWLEDMEEMARRGYPLLRRMHWSLMCAELWCGARVFFRSAEKVENSRGFEFADVEIDEGDYARDPANVLTTLAGRLSDSTAYLKQLTVTTTPYEYAGSMIQFWSQQRESAELMAPGLREQELRSWWFMRARTFDNPTLTPDFLRTLQTLSLSDYLKDALGFAIVQRQARVMAMYDPARHLFSRVAGHRFTYDPRKPYSLGIDWGLHRPSYGWFQEVTVNGIVRGVRFHEWQPEDVSELEQLEYLKQMAVLLKRPPSEAGVDKNNLEQIRRLERLFPGCRVMFDETSEEQSRKSSVSAVHALLEPVRTDHDGKAVAGEPLLLIADELAGEGASRRGVIAMFLQLQWEWDSRRGGYRDVADKDGVYDHVFDDCAYWAKHVGVQRAPAVRVHDTARGGGSYDDMLAALGIRTR